MSQSRQAIQARIQSIDSTKKITKAMQLVASSKLTRQRALMEDNREYAAALKDMLSLVLQSVSNTNSYTTENEGKPSFVFVITSDMGLCGGYNANVYRMIQEKLSSKDHIVIVGSRGQAWMAHRDYDVKASCIDLNEDAYAVLSKHMQTALSMFENKEIAKIQVLYTHYKNTLTFVPTLETILPVAKPEVKKAGSKAQMIFEPSQESMLSSLIPMVCKSVVYSYFLESKTSEQASRRMAMESATDNATQLQEELEFEFNQARQAAITQEITEIVSGANALA